MSRFCFVFFVSFFFSISSFGQQNQLNYSDHLSITEGIGHNGVTDIYQDSRGFMWIATFDGLNRYNGYEVKIFKNTVNKQLFASNRIRSLAEDNQGKLLIGTDEGLTTFNFSTQLFKNIYSNKKDGIGNKGPVIRDIFIDERNKNIVAITEREGLLLFDQNYKLVGRHNPKNEFVKSNILFYNGLSVGTKEYLIATSTGILSFDIVKKKFRLLFSDEITTSRALVKLRDDYYVSAGRGGVFILKYHKEKGYQTVKTIKSLEGLVCNSAGLDALGNLWVGTGSDGFFKVNREDIEKNNAKVIPQRFSDVDGKLRSSYINGTTGNGTWLATFNKGVFRLSAQDNPFKGSVKIAHPKLSRQEVSHLSVLDNERLYIALNRGGLALLNTKTGLFEDSPLEKTQKDLNKVNAVFIDSKRNIWLKKIGSNTIFRTKENGQPVKNASGQNPVLQNIVRNSPITEDKQGNIWVGTYGDLYKIVIDEKGAIVRTDSLSSNPMFLNNSLSRVRSLYVDENSKYMWVGTSADGLFRIDIDNQLPLNKKPIKQYLKDDKDATSIPSNFVSAILRMKNGDLWLGTERGGICKMIEDGNTPKFITYSEKDGLSNNVVKSILPDADGKLWISTNIGLNIFDPETSLFRKFDKEDGLPFQDFNYSSVQLNDGTIFLAGENGFTYFNPKNVPDNEPLPNLQWGDLRVYNELIAPNDTLNNRVLLNESLAVQEKLELNHDENVFSIEALALHYSSSSNHMLRYRLDPLNKDWVTVPSNQYFISYSGLPPGKYDLKVEASNSLNKWTLPLKLNIEIHPPWWKTNWAYALYSLLGALLIFTIIKVVLNLQSLNYKIAIEELEIKNIKEVNAAKLRFFTNISHEIKTPLTLIFGPVNMLIDRFKNNTDLTGKLQLVKRQTNKILQLIDQVQDFQKADAHFLKMNYSRLHFNDFIKEVARDFYFLAKMEKKEFIIEDGTADIYISADKDKLEKIVNNILNNAFKFTKTGDTISLKFNSEEKDLFIEITDTGRGIPDEDLPLIFDRFFQSTIEDSYHSTGSGIGLAFSKRLVEMHYGTIGVTSTFGERSTFSVRLPVVKEQLALDQEEKKKEIIKAEERLAHDEIQMQPLVDEVDVSKITVEANYKDTLVYYVEDIPDMRKYVSGILSNFFDIRTFNNGQECLDGMAEKWPEIIISDLLMPQVDGLELCKQIKADVKTSHIPVVLLTACTTIEDQIQGIKDGADAYIRKPFNVQHLISKIESLLHNRKKLRERFEIGLPITWEKNKNNRNDNAFIESLYGLMAKNIDNQNIDLNSFARELYLNRTHFYQKVKALTDQTPFELLKMYRLKKAAELLASGEYSVNEVFTMTGFKSRTHFSKIFKQTYDINPSKYAKELESSLVNEPEETI